MRANESGPQWLGDDFPPRFEQAAVVPDWDAELVDVRISREEVRVLITHYANLFASVACDWVDKAMMDSEYLGMQAFAQIRSEQLRKISGLDQVFFDAIWRFAFSNRDLPLDGDGPRNGDAPEGDDDE